MLLNRVEVSAPAFILAQSELFDVLLHRIAFPSRGQAACGRLRVIGVEKAGLNIGTGQTSSDMFLWHVVAKCCKEIDKILAEETHLPKNLTLSFRNSTDDAFDITCAQLRFEDGNTSAPRVLPDAQDLANDYFPEFEHWWVAMRLKRADPYGLVLFQNRLCPSTA
jgi:hypothetical protein